MARLYKTNICIFRDAIHRRLYKTTPRKSWQTGLGSALPCAPRLPTFLPVLPVTEQRLVLPRRTHWSDRLTTAAIVAAHMATVRIKVEVPRAARVVRVERTRPVAAAAACTDEAAFVAVACGRQEDTIAVGGGKESAIHSVLLCPGLGGVVAKLLPLFLGGRAPAIAPVFRSRVVLGLQDGQIVHPTVCGIVVV